MIDRPTIFEILLGRHAYSMEPEYETAWCWVCLIYGWVAGVATVLAFTGKLR